MKRRVQAQDSRWWTVQRVWWPRPGQTAIATGAALDSTAGSRYGGGGAALGLIFDAALVVVWPVVLLLRVLLHRPWIVEAFPDDNLGVEGAAWAVKGLGASAACVDAVAAGIRAGDRSPAPASARSVRFRRKLRAERFRL